MKISRSGLETRDQWQWGPVALTTRNLSIRKSEGRWVGIVRCILFVILSRDSVRWNWHYCKITHKIKKVVTISLFQLQRSIQNLCKLCCNQSEN
jgi:hypothetical protein